MDELEAVLKLKLGDKETLNFFFNKYYNRLIAYVMTYNQDIFFAEDIVQQAFVKFWLNRAKLDETRSPKNYLYTITFNLYVDAAKKADKERQCFYEVWKRSLDETIQEDDTIFEDRIHKMNTILSTLPPKCKKIVQLNKVEGVKYRDIALQLDISIKTVESQMRIAFQKIRKEFC